ncbi:MAG: hypothetical protein ACREEM_44475, partial [Blastocatellia bacterium]
IQKDGCQKDDISYLSDRHFSVAGRNDDQGLDLQTDLVGIRNQDSGFRSWDLGFVFTGNPTIFGQRLHCKESGANAYQPTLTSDFAAWFVAYFFAGARGTTAITKYTD